MTDPTQDRRIDGSCHCGNIRFAFHRPHGDGTIPVRLCGCTFCVKHGGRWTSHPNGSFTLLISDRSRATVYQFGTRSADFHVCSTCGVAPIVTCLIDGRRYAVVNANAFEGIDRSALIEARADFEGELLDVRMARRLRNWTPERVA